MKNQYTVSDLYALKDLITKYFGDVKTFDFYLSVLDKLKNHAIESEISSELIEEMLLNWTKEFRFSYSMIASFIFRTKLKEVPLFLNDNDLKLFVEWRLKIAK